MECAVRISHWFPRYFVLSFALPFSSAAKADGIVTLEMSDKYIQSSRKGFQCVIVTSNKLHPPFSLFSGLLFRLKSSYSRDGTIIRWKAFFKKFGIAYQEKNVLAEKNYPKAKRGSEPSQSIWCIQIWAWIGHATLLVVVFFFPSNFQNSESGWFGSIFHSRWFVPFWISTMSVVVGKGVPIFPWNAVHKISLIHGTGLAHIDFLLSVQDVPMI